MKLQLQQTTRRSLYTVPERFSHLPGMEGHSWKDNFFDGHDNANNVIAVFDKDVQKMEDFYERSFPFLQRTFLFFCLIFNFLDVAYYTWYHGIPWRVMTRVMAPFLLIGCVMYCNMKATFQRCLEFARDQHMAVTTEGLMTLKLNPWRLLFTVMASYLVPSFIYTCPPPERKISKVSTQCLLISFLLLTNLLLDVTNK